MSTICINFIENAWRKDLCANCFRTKEEHLAIKSKMYAQRTFNSGHVSINVHHQNGLPEIGYQGQTGRIPTARGRSSNLYSAYESPNRERVNVVNQPQLQQQHHQHQQQQRRNQSMITNTQDNGSNVNVNGSNYNTKAMSHHQPKFNPGQSQSQNQRNISNIGVTSGSSTLSVKSSLRMDKRTPGILKKSNKRKMSVSFPKEVVSVIGYGGSDSSSDSESDSEPVADPLDNLTITEIMQRNSNTATEREINRQTIRNTSFNSIKNNLLGYAPLIIGPIVGGTGGKSKPVVTIGSFGESQGPAKTHQVATSNGVKISVGQGNSQIIENRQTMTNGSRNQTSQINVPVSRVPSVSVQTNSSRTSNIQQNNVQIVSPQVQSSQNQRVTTQIVAPVRNSLNGRNTVTTRASTASTTTQQNTNIIRVSSSAILPPMPSPRSSLANANANANAIMNAKDSIKSEQSIIIMNGGLIASKRTSFLHGILGDQPGEELNPGMQLPMDSLEPAAMAALVQAQQEINSEQPRPNPAQTIIDFDSLEDSGIENKAESDMNVKEERQPSLKPAEDSSDSGNENDFSESSCSNVPRPESSGLLIACSDLAETRIDASKLSPDSVISNTSSGSSESLEKQNIQEREPSPPIMSMPIQMPMQVPVTIPPMLKRPAPLPPIAPQLNTPERRPSRSMSSQDLAAPRRSIQTQDLAQIRRSAHSHIPERNSPERNSPPKSQSNSPRHSELQCDELYDDINGACHKSEDIYDDCTSASANGNANQRSATYDLTDTRLPPIRTDGIEFIGIRKIDEDAPPPVSAEPIEPPIKEKKVRKVNQFFSTIGKKAGAAFGANRSVVESSEKSPDSSRPFTRSLSIDEVNITRTQGIYATLSPSLFRGTGFLNKLKGEEPVDDVRKGGRKFSVVSLRKFLGLTGRDERKVDVVGQPGEAPQAQASPPNPRTTFQSPPAWKLPPARPPPPPPRVGSLDLLDRCGQASKPARPPPPAVLRPAAPLPKEEPEFLSVFQGQGPSYSQSQGPNYSQSQGHQGQGQGQPPTHRTPNKPRRKASMRCGETSDGGAYTANYLETTYNHITSLNFETLKLIASQEAALIQSTNHPKPYNVLRFTNFYVTDVDPICCGNGYCFYSAFWEDTDCIILIQESLTSGRMPLEFNCVQQMATFEDVVPQQFVKWEPSDFVKCSGGIKAFITILPSCNVAKLSTFIANPSIPITRKYFTVLQAMDHWGSEDLADLVVFHQPIEESAQPNVVGLIYVCSSRIKSGCFISSNNSRANFELSLRQLLVNLLNDNDKQILHRRLYSCGSAEVEAQLRLFIQLKLFGPQGSDLDKILRYRSSKQVTQWMDKERAASMKDAIERTLRRHTERIEPLRKAFVEFLMMSDNCAAGVLDFVVDMNPDF